MNKYLFLFLISTVIFSCKSTQTDTDSSETITKSVFKKESTTVKAEKVHQGTFNLEIISNGKVYAVNSSDIKFSYTPYQRKVPKYLIEAG